MPHAVTQPIPPVTSASGRLVVYGIPAASDNLVWLLVETATGECAIVDGPDAGGALAAIEHLGLNLTTILNTHGHGDHVGVNHDLQRRGHLSHLRVVGGSRSLLPIPGITEQVDHGDTVTFSGSTGRVLGVDGHVTGHIAFVFEDLAFVGDTLFAGGCGYLFDGPPAAMHRSLGRLAELPRDTYVFCAHEYTEDNLRFAWSIEPDNEALANRIASGLPGRRAGRCLVPSTVGLELDTNPFLRTGVASLRARVAAATGQPLDSDVATFAATRALKDGKAYRSAPWPPG